MFKRASEIMSDKKLEVADNGCTWIYFLNDLNDI